MARALTAPAVVAAFLASPDPVAIAAFEWSGDNDQVPLWDGFVTVRGADDLAPLADALRRTPRSRDNMPTAMGPALGHAASLLANGPACLNRTIDIAGDGFHNEGFGPAIAYRIFPFDGVTVNALVIAGGDDPLALISWFGEEVLHGPGAFMEVTDSFDDYAAAMERKLLRELALPALSLLPAQ